MVTTQPATHTVETVEITLFLLGFLNRASEVRILSGVPISNRLKTLIFQRFRRFLFCSLIYIKCKFISRFGAFWCYLVRHHLRHFLKSLLFWQLQV